MPKISDSRQQRPRGQNTAPETQFGRFPFATLGARGSRDNLGAGSAAAC